MKPKPREEALTKGVKLIKNQKLQKSATRFKWL
jgi:hypothetical protein